MLVLLVPFDEKVEEIIRSLFGKCILVQCDGAGLGTLLDKSTELYTGMAGRLLGLRCALKQFVKDITGIP
jgi:hypothetical protein